MKRSVFAVVALAASLGLAGCKLVQPSPADGSGIGSSTVCDFGCGQ